MGAIGAYQLMVVVADICGKKGSFGENACGSGEAPIFGVKSCESGSGTTRPGSCARKRLCLTNTGRHLFFNLSNIAPKIIYPRECPHLSTNLLPLTISQLDVHIQQKVD
jgi:hypothetical protein